MLLTTPMLRILKTTWPDAKIHLLASDYSAWVVEDNADIDKRWIYGRVRTGRRINFGAALRQPALYWQLKRERFDVAIAAGGAESPRAIKRALHVHANKTIAYASSAKWHSRLTDPQTVNEADHEALRIARHLTPLGITLPTILPHPEYQPPALALQFADQWLSAQSMVAKKYWLLGIGARNHEVQPTTQQILSWATWMHENHGLATVFIWTPGQLDNPLYRGDDAIVKPVLNARLPYVIPFRGLLKEAIGLIWRARTSLIPDSGLMHFAAASPGGVLGLFANSRVLASPHQWGPQGRRVEFLDAPKNVNELSDAVVFERLTRLLS